MTRTSSFDAFEQAMHGLSRRLNARDAMRSSVLIRLFQHTGMHLNDFMDAPFRQHGLNETLWISLVMIYADTAQRLKPSELSVFMNSSRMNSTRVARQLEARGFIRRVTNPHDRRQIFLEMMPSGTAFVEALLPLRRDYMQGILAGFSSAEVNQLEHLLRKLLGNLE